MKAIKIVEFVDNSGKSPYAKWFAKLNSYAAACVAKELYKIELGNMNSTKSVKGGVYELKVDFGPGYRVYFGKEGDEIIILLARGTKKRQQNDIDEAKKYWLQYKQAKKRESKGGK